jgi:hypothetical protein
VIGREGCGGVGVVVVAGVVMGGEREERAGGCEVGVDVIGEVIGVVIGVEIGEGGGG